MFSFRNAPNFVDSEELKDHAHFIMRIMDFAINDGPEVTDRSGMVISRGHRHKQSGMKMKHYEMAVQSMCLVIKDILGNQYTDEINAAWIDYMGMFFGVMTKNVY